MTGPISDCGSPMALSLVRTELEGKTVLQVLSALEAGGAELGTLDISAPLRDAGAPVLVASSGASDVAVSASVRPESFGRVLAEAGAMGLPVVSSDLGAAREIVLHGEIGWLVPPGNPAALAEDIRKALVAAGPALAARARAHILAHYTRDRMCAKTLAVYRELR